MDDAVKQGIKEALEFSSHLKSNQNQAEWRDLIDAQSESMSAVWDNPEDEVWNDL